MSDAVAAAANHQATLRECRAEERGGSTDRIGSMRGSAAASARAVAGRVSGFGAIASRMACSSMGLMSGASADSRSRVAAESDSRRWRWPVTSSNSTAPRAYTSLRSECGMPGTTSSVAGSPVVPLIE